MLCVYRNFALQPRIYKRKHCNSNTKIVNLARVTVLACTYSQTCTHTEKHIQKTHAENTHGNKHKHTHTQKQTHIRIQKQTH